MSRQGDHHDEMPGPAALDDATLEAFLSGRPLGAGELGPLAAFAEDVRVAVDGPAPVPTAEMARLLTEGIPTPTGVTRAALAPRAGTRDAAVSKRRKTMTISELLAALMAKLAGLGAASKAALGLGVAAASVTGAGAAGVLPEPAQRAVAQVVSAATPFELEDPTDAVGEVGDDTEAGDAVDDGDGDTNGEDGTKPTDNHGACVSEAAHNAPRGPGGEHGRAVSAVARSDCGKTTATSSPSTTTTVPGSTTTTTVDDGETSVEANRGPGSRGNGGGNPNRGNSGPGNSGNGNTGPGNSGNGNSGPGNSGNGGGHGPGRSGK
ncbi:MAG TPA: hypothetical protein VHG90_03875 [Acidimicrobiales bacterium]|nr:hypothetical protein [Acidimicrobiales bacterium]